MESNLYDELLNRQIELSKTQLKALLMKLELHGKLRVTSLDKERKMVELVQKENFK